MHITEHHNDFNQCNHVTDVIRCSVLKDFFWFLGKEKGKRFYISFSGDLKLKLLDYEIDVVAKMSKYCAKIKIVFNQDKYHKYGTFFNFIKYHLQNFRATFSKNVNPSWCSPRIQINVAGSLSVDWRDINHKVEIFINCVNSCNSCNFSPWIGST